jgi:hypothetical protein
MLNRSSVGAHGVCPSGFIRRASRMIYLCTLDSGLLSGRLKKSGS